MVLGVKSEQFDSTVSRVLLSLFFFVFFGALEPAEDGGGVAGVAEVLAGLLKRGAACSEVFFYFGSHSEELVEVLLYFKAHFIAVRLGEGAPRGLNGVVGFRQHPLTFDNLFCRLRCKFFGTLDEFQNSCREVFECGFFGWRFHLIIQCKM